MPMEVSSDDRKGRLCQFSKTKLCKFNVIGKCTKGEQCPFAHENLDLRKLPDLRCTKLCKMLIQTGQCTSKGCTYAHTKEELRSTGAYHKTKLCRFMQTGHCTLGSKCNFAHSSVELREPETIDALAAPPGLGWESMIDGLLSDNEDESVESKPEDLIKPVYVNVPSMASDQWAFNTSSISEESTDCEDGFAAFQEDTGLNALWDYQSQLAASNAMGFPMGDMGCYPLEGSGLGYGAGYNAWSSPWAGAPMPEEVYANSLFSSGFGGFGGSGFGGFSNFGDNVVVDQTDFLKMKGARPDKATRKMRSVRTSESTICTLGDTTQA